MPFPVFFAFALFVPDGWRKGDPCRLIAIKKPFDSGVLRALRWDHAEVPLRIAD